MAAISAGAMAQGKVTAADSTATENAAKEEGNRNVMLNAASACLLYTSPSPRDRG